ncbi:hypothetical protein CD32_09420 [Lysinibacillus odysseyi 34hs-1 = NBRC 100172]|uniref:Uncharacterized protein n=1 Tax=Lysinibacillus odysseyi 34hs-1 = NBRC 100172 TaxID=1220589 RepID=A0A0A3IRC7_9BACI|nr:hypothetical protein CD32_09420 [Lysinibacillus odysseyi 34hs-1 = NBRC 100172]
MDILQYFIVSFIVVLLAQIIMSVIYKDVEKKDKGFVFVYYKLTYRRRFIRALWTAPLLFLFYFAIYWFGDLSITEFKIIGVILLLLVVLDISYNYKKWKRQEKIW